MVSKFNISIQKEKKSEHKESFNFKNVENLKIWKDENDNGTDVVKSLQGNGTIEEKMSKWFKSMNRKFHKCFRKIRVTKNKKKNEIELKMNARLCLKDS